MIELFIEFLLYQVLKIYLKMFVTNIKENIFLINQYQHFDKFGPSNQNFDNFFTKKNWTILTWKTKYLSSYKFWH